MYYYSLNYSTKLTSHFKHICLGNVTTFESEICTVLSPMCVIRKKDNLFCLIKNVSNMKSVRVYFV